MSSQYPYATGWANYQDSYFTSSQVFTASADTDYEVPINAQVVDDDQLPMGISAMYVPTTILYDNEAGGPFTVGETITGGTSGATAIVTAIDDDGTTGTFYLAKVIGTFVDNEVLTGGTSSATANANGAVDFGGIEGLDGDAILIELQFMAKPSTASAIWVDTWVDIGGGIGEIFRGTKTMPKGNGAEHTIARCIFAFNRSTWEANRGMMKFRFNQTAQVYDAQVNLGKVHRARS